MRHVIALSWSLNVPAAQGVGASVPTGQYVPTGHVMHSSRLARKPTVARTVWLACLPPGHGCAALEPCTQRRPRMQSSQAVLFDESAYLPASHWMHVAWPVVGLYRPGKHGDGATEPVAHAEPAGHMVQAEASTRLELFE